MRIAVDMQGAQGENSNRGIGRYSIALVKQMIKSAHDDEFILVLNGMLRQTIENVKAEFSELIPADNFRVWNSLAPVNYAEQSSKTNRTIAELTYEAFLLEQQPDFIFITSLFEGLADNAACSVHQLQQSVPVAVVLYDLIPLIYPDKYLSNPVVKNWYLEKLEHLKKADLFLSISDSSRQEGLDILKLPHDCVVNISTDANSEFQPIAKNAETHKVASQYGLNKPFIMYTGGIDHRKNIEGLISAYSLLPHDVRQKHQLAIICAIQPESMKSLGSLVKECGLKEADVIFTGFVSNEHLVALYNTCSLFVFPSFHEGFGLPVLEAMRCGALVLCSNKSSLPEVIGDDAATFDPYSHIDIAESIARVLTDNEFAKELRERQQLQAKSFSWEKSAARAIAAMKGYREKRLSTVGSDAQKRLAKPKMAYVSPIPSAKSGIADYSAELLVTLTEYYDIDVISAQSEPVPDHAFQTKCNIQSVDYFLSNSEQYDRVMYHFGNSSYHQHMFSLLEKVPGVVVLHDFFLSGIQSYRESHYREENVWSQELLKSHGYQALKDKFTYTESSETIWKYPTNLTVLQQAKGVIVHSEHPLDLVKYWYGAQTSNIFNVIPLLRTAPDKFDKSETKKQLGFKETDLLVCTFGILGESKLNHELLDAWLNSDLAGNSSAHLVFVGNADDSVYCQELRKKIQASPFRNNIKITGWTSDKSYKQYLQATDIGVQLRNRSRGETSAAVLDCMNYGIATIVNAHGSMASIDSSAVAMLPDKFNTHALTSMLEDLASDNESRTQLGEKSRQLVLSNHNPEYCAGLYYNAMEPLYNDKRSGQAGLIDNIASLNLPIQKIQECAISLAKNFPPKFRKRQILVDISELVQRDARSGIQRVVREILSQFIAQQPNDVLIEPVYATECEKGYRYARQFTCEMLNIPSSGIFDTPVDAWQGDIFLGIDWQPSVIPQQAQVLKDWKNNGVRVWFVIYDLLPILKEKHFPEGASTLYTKWLKTISQFDGAACISKTVASEYAEWLNDNNYSESKRPSINWFHLGADLNENLQVDIPSEKSLPSQLQGLSDKPVFLMVGTVEPRKGHAQVLAAFEQLWQKGVNANLVIVGKQGWLVEDFVNSLAKHEQNGNKLHWLSSVNDAELKQIYHMSTCLIAASEGEGFGLPLIEASQFKLPIIARDIPVFREVAGDSAFYFDSKGTSTLAKAISDWLALYKENAHPCSTDIEWITWRESASDLLTLIKNS